MTPQNKGIKKGTAGASPYIWAGITLLITGALVAILFYFFFDVVWLTALGLAMLIVSFIMIAFGQEGKTAPSRLSELYLAASIANTTEMIEELGVKSKAIYLPPRHTGGKSKAFISFKHESKNPVQKILPKRLIVRYGNNPDEVGLLLSTLGTAAVEMLEYTPGATTSEYESALAGIVIANLGIAEGLSVLTYKSGLTIDFKKPRRGSEIQKVQCLGSPIAQIAATIAAMTMDKSFIVAREKDYHGKLVIELESLS